MRPGRRRDKLWEHVKEQPDGRFTCNYCDETFKGGGSRIKSHLKGIKGGGIRRCPKSPFIDKNKALLHDSGTISNSTEIIPSASDHNTTQSPSFVDANLNEDVNNLIVEFLSLNKLPLETIEQPCFRNLFGTVARAGTKYELPTSIDFNDSLPFVKEVSQYIRKVCSSFETYRCTVVVHVEPEVEYVFENTGEEFFNEFSNGMSIYSPEGVICTYPANTYFSVESSFLHLYHEIKRSIKECPLVFALIDSRKQVDLDSCEIGETHYCAIKSIIVLLEHMFQKSYFFNFVVSKRYKSLLKSKRESSEKGRHEKDGQICNDPLLSGLQSFLQDGACLPNWVDEEELNSVGPLIRMLFIFDNFVPNIGYFYGAILKAETRLELFRGDLQSFDEIWELFTYFKDNVLDPIHRVAAYLNPGYMFYNKNLLHDESTDMLLERLYSFLETDASEEVDEEVDEEVVEEEVDVYDKMDKSIFTPEAISMLHSYHPVLWWKKFGSRLPCLQRYAICLLSQRVNCLSHSNHKLKFDCWSDNMLGANAVMMEEFRKWKQENDTIFKPIDLNILDTPIFIPNKENDTSMDV